MMKCYQMMMTMMMTLNISNLFCVFTKLHALHVRPTFAVQCSIKTVYMPHYRRVRLFNQKKTLFLVSLSVLHDNI